MLYDRLQSKTSAVPSPGTVATDVALCSEAGCDVQTARHCSYVDRRQRSCPSAWCDAHAQMVFGGPYCRRHAGVIAALGPDYANVALPDLDNRAPALANWVGRDLDEPIRTLVDGYFHDRRMNVSPVVAIGTPRERVWGRTWKLISENGVDLSIGISVPEAEDHVVRVIVDGRIVSEMTPPWIEARRHRINVAEEDDVAARAQFYSLIMEDVEAGILEAKRRDPLRLGSLL